MRLAVVTFASVLWVSTAQAQTYQNPQLQHPSYQPPSTTYQQATQQTSSAYYPTPAKREPERKRWYAAFHAQYVMTDDYALRDTVPGGTLRGAYEFDDGFGLGGSLGYQPLSFLRLEGEYNYRTLDLDRGYAAQYNNAGTLVAQNSVSGDDYAFDTINLMANAIIDVPLPFSEEWSPYVGGGLGWSFQTNGAKANSFAHQMLAGINWQADAETVFNLGWRYFEASGYDFDFENDYEAGTHTVELGARFHF